MEIKDRKEVEEMYREFVAPDGLMNLNSGKFHESYEEVGVETCDNMNGILYLAEFHLLLKTHRLIDIEDAFRANDAIEMIQEKPGYFHRNPGRVQEKEAHDNYNGITALSILHNLDYPKEIVQAGLKNGFTFDNANPGRFSLEHWRQGIDVTHYKLAAGYVPSPDEILWFVGGTAACTFYDPVEKSSEWLLNWVRLKSLDLLLEKKARTFDRSTRNIFEVIGAAREFWKWRLNKKTDGRGIEAPFETFFKNPKHPNRILSKGLKY